MSGTAEAARPTTLSVSGPGSSVQNMAVIEAEAKIRNHISRPNFRPVRESCGNALTLSQLFLMCVRPEPVLANHRFSHKKMNDTSRKEVVLDDTRKVRRFFRSPHLTMSGMLKRRVGTSAAAIIAEL